MEDIGPATVEDELRRATEALESGDMASAIGHYEAVLGVGESAEARLGLAIGYLCQNKLTASRDELRTAYTLFRRSGRPARAATVACLLAFDEASVRGNVSVARGWFRRAGLLLEDLEPSPEHGWLKLWGAWFEGDPSAMRDAAAETADMARRFDDHELEVLSQAVHGQALVDLGEVTTGMALLDGAMASVLAGEVRQPLVVFDCLCALLVACERAGDYGRAEEWCRVALEVAQARSISFMATACRTTYGGILCVLGRCGEAEAELNQAVRDGYRYARLEALALLADLRRRQGRLQDAYRLLEEAAGSPAAARVAAELALDTGDFALARRHGEQMLALAGPRVTDRAVALQLVARAASGGMDLVRGEAAVAELETVAATIGTAPVIAGLWNAKGTLAQSGKRHAEAATAFWEAVQLYTGAGAVYEAARSRLGLAAALRAGGNGDNAAREERAAREALRGLAGDQAASLTARELEVLRRLAAGLTNAEAAAQLGVSAHTVHRHVANLFVKLNVPSRAAAVAEAARLGLI